MDPVTKIKGFADLFDPDSRVMNFIEQTAGQVFSRYGYQELRLPLLERTELFSRSIGEGTDVVQKEMYTFSDRKGRSLTLRPEATAGVVRASIEHNLPAPGHICKFFSYGPMFRYERPQKGRMRQFHQINAECLGPAEPQADGELIVMLMNFLQQLGLQDFALEINNLGCANCRPANVAALKDFLRGLDELEMCADCRTRKDSNPLRVLDCKMPKCRCLTASAPAIAESACAGCREHFSQVCVLLDDAGRKYSINPRLVRGLDYYVRTTFEVVSGDIGAQSSVAGGGRYDGLMRNLGGRDVPSLGFACGMERLALLLTPPAAERPDFFIAPLCQEAVNKGWLLAQKLRQTGLGGQCAYSSASLKSLLKQADRLQAVKVIILGPDELAAAAALVRDMSSGAQSSRTLDELGRGKL